MKSPLIIKHSVVLREDHKTSVSLEAPFYEGVKEIARAEGISVGELISKIDSERRRLRIGNLSSTLRLRVLEHYKAIADARIRPEELRSPQAAE